MLDLTWYYTAMCPYLDGPMKQTKAYPHDPPFRAFPNGIPPHLLLLILIKLSATQGARQNALIERIRFLKYLT